MRPQTLADSLTLRYRLTALWASYGGRLPLGEDRSGSPSLRSPWCRR
ncbi:MAG: hypothetical protein KME40_22525 [Komarekiella atlantica HA4396-MV6]|nr:hypothetical protein [Komarekiella atlantica HA4396-MV6]